MTKPIFTVFTPTYNRAKTLPRVYESLINQTFKQFEWLIVDDGSTDTTDVLIKRYINKNAIQIRYIEQTNSGKHVAFNRGVREAHGELFLPLDSDDDCTATTLERFLHHWNGIPENVRQSFSGITCLCIDDSGKIVGGELPAPTLDGYPFKVLDRLRRTGEMWGFHRTEILRKYPFPEMMNERFVPEGLVWNRIGRYYKIRFVNEALRGYHESADSLSSKMMVIRSQSPLSTILYYREVLELPIRQSTKFKAAINIWRFAYLSGHSELGYILISKYPVYLIVCWAPAHFLALYERFRLALKKRVFFLSST